MTIQQMREERAALAKALRNLHENNKHNWGGPEGENQKEYDRLANRIMDLDAAIEREQRVLDLEASEKFNLARRAEENGKSVDEQIHDERKLLQAWMRGGIEALSPEQREIVRQRAVQNALSTGVPSEGGYTVPREFSAQLIEAMKAFGGMRLVANVISTSTGAPFDHPTTDGTEEVGEIVGENAEVTDQDPSFGSKTIGAYKYSSKGVAVPFELLQDTGINLEAFITQRLAMRLARITNRHFTVGTGVNQPEGIVTAAQVGVTGGAGQTDSVTWVDLVDLIHSVDPAYRMLGNTRFMFHDTTLRALKKLTDGEGRPLWLPGVATKEPDTFLGEQYVINQDMPEMAPGAKSILFGDFSFYTIRDVMSTLLFRMTDSFYTRKGQVGFLAFSRHDGKFLDVGGAVKAYQNAEE